MIKTILIPTDFTVQSMLVFKHAMELLDDTKANILLVHGMYLPDSISDLLFFSKAEQIEKLETDEFVSSCWLMKNRFQSKIESIHLDVFAGFTRAAFQNYLDSNRVDEAFIPRNYNFIRHHKRSFDVIPFIRKSNLEVTEVDCEIMVEPDVVETRQLEVLFFNKSQAY